MGALNSFLLGYDGRPMRVGCDDCALFAADWVKFCTGHDPAQGWRETYCTEVDAEAILAGRGGMVALFDDVARFIGWSRREVPSTGAVIVAKGVDGRLIAGIRNGEFTAFRIETGLMRTRLPLSRVCGIWSA